MKAKRATFPSLDRGSQRKGDPALGTREPCATRNDGRAGDSEDLPSRRRIDDLLHRLVEVPAGMAGGSFFRSVILTTNPDDERIAVQAPRSIIRREEVYVVVIDDARGSPVSASFAMSVKPDDNCPSRLPLIKLAGKLRDDIEPSRLRGFVQGGGEGALERVLVHPGGGLNSDIRGCLLWTFASLQNRRHRRRHAMHVRCGFFGRCAIFFRRVRTCA